MPYVMTNRELSTSANIFYNLCKNGVVEKNSTVTVSNVTNGMYLLSTYQGGANKNLTGLWYCAVTSYDVGCSAAKIVSPTVNITVTVTANTVAITNPDSTYGFGYSLTKLIW